MKFDLQVLGTLNVVDKTFTGGTPGIQGIPPYGGPPGSGNFIYRPRVPNLQLGEGVPHITKVCYTTGLTAHKIALMRPFNYTYVSSDAAINQAVINIKADPGVYSTNFNYSIPNSKPAAVADNAIAANDWCAYQLVDGTWIFDKVSSVSTLAITMATSIPNITGGGVKEGSPFYFFGVVGDKDPNTGLLNPQTTIAASQTRDATWADDMFGIMAALHPGDPLIFYSPATTNDGTLEFISGFYARI